jgi:hypothetical protein
MLRYVNPGIFESDELVVGATLEALDFAKDNNLPVLTSRKVVYSDLDVLNGKKAEDIVCSRKMSLCLNGKILFPSVNKIFYREDHLTIISETSSQKLYFNKIYLFDPEEIDNLKITSVKFHIIDLFKREYIKTPEQLLYPSEESFHKLIEFREPGLILAHSLLTKKEMASQETSEFISKKRLYWWLRQNGFKSHVTNNKMRLFPRQRFKKAVYEFILPDNIVDKVVKNEENRWHSPFSKETFNSQ